jgi:hypothetical protein
LTAIQTPFGSAAGRYAFLGSMSLENCYVELQGPAGKAKYVVLPSDGAIEHSEVTDTPCRGFIFLEDLDLLYTFHGSSAWKVNSAGVATYVGTIPGIDRVQLTRNKKATPQITVRCDAGLYLIENDIILDIVDADLPDDIVTLDTLGEYTLYGNEDGRVFYSEQGETVNVDALDFFTAEQSADKLVRIKVDQGAAFLFNQNTIEEWPLTGNADSPFEFRRVIQKGLKARDSVVHCDLTLMWVGNDGIVYRLEGYSPKRISNHEVERLIDGDDAAEDILGFTWSRGGHTFYALKGSDWTRVYDASTGEWHKRKSTGLDVWRFQFAAMAWGRPIFGDQESGGVFYPDADTYTEDGEIMTYKVRSPFMHAFPDGGIVDRISVDFLAGQGVTLASAQGFNPILMVSHSIDGGNTFSVPRHIAMGHQGEYDTEVNSWRWGKFGSKGVVWELSVTDPVGRALANMDCKVRPLKRLM